MKLSRPIWHRPNGDRELTRALYYLGARDVLATPTPGNAALRQAIQSRASEGLRLRLPGDDETGAFEAIRLSFEQDVPGVVLLPPGATGLLAIPALRVALRSKVPLLCILEAPRRASARIHQLEALRPFARQELRSGTRERMDQIGRTFAAIGTALHQGGPVLLEWHAGGRRAVQPEMARPDSCQP